MRKLSKVQMGKLSEIQNRMSNAMDTISNATEMYNEALQEAKDFCEEIAGEIEEYIDGRSEAWQEGDKADAYGTWLSEWQDIELGEEIEEIETPEGVEALENLPTEPES